MQEEDDADGDVLSRHARTQPDFGGQEAGLNINRSKKKHSPHFAPTDLLALPAQKSSASNHHQAQKKRQLEPGILRALGDGPDRLPAPKLRRQRRHERVGVLRPHAQVSHDPHPPTATPCCNPIWQKTTSTPVSKKTTRLCRFQTSFSAGSFGAILSVTFRAHNIGQLRNVGPVLR